MARGSRTGARQALSQLLSGGTLVQAISVAASLGVADLLEQRPQNAAALAKATRTHEESLYRLMRALSAAGVFAERRGGRFALTPLSRLLRAASKNSMRSVACLAGDQWRRVAFGLSYSVRTGRPAFERELGVPFYDYLSAHPRARRLFADVMAYNWRIAPSILRRYAFAAVRTIVDVGGGSGAMMESILRRNPATSGVIVDVPAVAAETRRRVRSARLSSRCRVVGGDFFRPLPRGGDLYILAFVLHNWDDRRASEILRGCRRAMASTARLLIIESPLQGRRSFAAIHDLEMLLLMPGGRERTLADYRRLLASAGLRLVRVIPTDTTARLIEAANDASSTC